MTQDARIIPLQTVPAALMALCQTVQALKFNEGADLRNYLTVWMAENPAIAHAMESLDLLRLINMEPVLVSRLEVAKHLEMCETPYRVKEPA